MSSLRGQGLEVTERGSDSVVGLRRRPRGPGVLDRYGMSKWEEEVVRRHVPDVCSTR